MSVGQQRKRMRAVPIFTASPTMVIRLGATHNGTWLTTKFHLKMTQNKENAEWQVVTGCQNTVDLDAIFRCCVVSGK